MLADTIVDPLPIADPLPLVILDPVIEISPVLPEKPKEVGLAIPKLEVVGSVVRPNATLPMFRVLPVLI